VTLMLAPLAGRLVKLGLGQQLATKGAVSTLAGHGFTLTPFQMAASAFSSSSCALLMSARTISGEELDVACRCACPAI
jgi:hypothetical protein